MQKNYFLIGGIIVVVVILIGVVYFNNFSANSPAQTQTTSSKEPAANNQNSNTGSLPGISQNNQSDGVVANPPVQENIVNYTDSGYLPKVLKVKVGTTVTFKNESSGKIRTASNPHPIHTGYPTKGGCVNSTFDECQGDAPGTSWQFKFDFPGSWGYHNHMSPSDTGTIIVE